MVRLLSILFFLFAATAQAAFVGNNATVCPANSSFTTTNTGSCIPLSQLSQATANSAVFSIYGGNGGTNQTTGNYYPFYYNGAPFHTGAGKHAYCFDKAGLASTANLDFQLVSSSIAINFNQSAALTNGIYQCGAAGVYCDRTAGTTKSPLAGLYTFGDGVNDAYAGFQSNSSAQSYELSMQCYIAP